MLEYISLLVLLSIHMVNSRCQILLQILHTFWIFLFSFLYFFLFFHHAIFFLFQLMLDSLEQNVLFLHIFYTCFPFSIFHTVSCLLSFVPTRFCYVPILSTVVTFHFSFLFTI